ncbi:hypothetical protein F0L68_17640 [Solihabitans fulvus]|uniref:SWIM-type domain-containing protein n=2 Tax=Solihabitans fulvus TaxID=1892852 RepID=A0A5B2XE26_9PSEU|nr:hypothetical protein F0L68_17640 [Solihabitans fulvus]
MGGRLERGRRYARAGQVLSLSLATSVVVAQVQGSRESPYRARIGIRAFTPAEWKRIEEALAGQALYAAKLLAGEMPTDVEAVLGELGLRLFPDTMRELSMDCTCPDWEVPCKHLAAACYLLAESFDEDPFKIFAWRGRSRDELLDRLRALRGSAAPVHRREDDVPALADCLDSFWVGEPVAPAPIQDGAGPADAVLDQLDPLPITVGDRPLVDLLRPAYRAMTAEEAP